jgi:hypothetical protein
VTAATSRKKIAFVFTNFLDTKEEAMLQGMIEGLIETGI